jgi:hypothetical protein
VIFVFKTGETDEGVMDMPDLTVGFIANLRVLDTVWPLILTVIGMSTPLASAVASKAEVKQTSSVLRESFGSQTVALAFPNLISTVLEDSSQGKLVPVIVMLSAPIRLRAVVGCADAMEHETVWVATVPAFGIIPS